MNQALVAAEYSPEYYDQLLTESEAASFLGYSNRALQNWRLRGGGPQYVKVSRRSVRYQRKELLSWIQKRMRASTSDGNAS